jgi:hypothetical protein
MDAQFASFTASTIPLPDEKETVSFLIVNSCDDVISF